MASRAVSGTCSTALSRDWHSASNPKSSGRVTRTSEGYERNQHQGARSRRANDKGCPSHQDDAPHQYLRLVPLEPVLGGLQIREHQSLRLHLLHTLHVLFQALLRTVVVVLCTTTLAWPGRLRVPAPSEASDLLGRAVARAIAREHEFEGARLTKPLTRLMQRSLTLLQLHFRAAPQGRLSTLACHQHQQQQPL